MENMEGIMSTSEEIKETNGSLENTNSNNDHAYEQPGGLEINTENDENSESDAELLERIRALENKVTQQNQQIVGLALALKMGKDETDGFLIKEALPTLRNMQNVSYLTKTLVEPRSLTEIYSTRPADFIWTITDIKQKMKSQEFELVSEEFQLSDYPNKAKAKIQLKADGVLRTSLLIIDDGSESSFKNLKVLPAVVYVLKSQFESKKYDIIRPVIYTFGRNNLDFTAFNYEYAAFHKIRLMNFISVHNRNNAITLEFHVEPPAITRHVYSYNRTLNWAIVEYKKNKRMARINGQSFECSPYIYVRGYRIQAHMYLNGLGDFQRRGLSANVLFLTGENDELLPKSFLHRTTITLVDQKHPEGNVVKSVEKDIEKAGNNNYVINLATYEEMEKLISKDILYYEIRIDPVIDPLNEVP